MRSLLLASIVMSFSLDFCWAQASAAADIRIARIGDVKSFKQEGDLGHCTGFLYGNRLYTAAHCNHFEQFVLVSQEGKVFLDLKGHEKFYLRNEVGLLDVVFLNLEPREVDILKLKGEKVDTSAGGAQLAGYPIFLRGEQATVLNCDSFFSQPQHIKFELEHALQVQQFNCHSSNKAIENVGQLTHSQIKGMSGGPMIIDGEIAGVGFHYSDPASATDSGLLKAVYFKTGQQEITESAAVSTFSLRNKLLEEVKQPNKSLMDMDEFLISQLKFKNTYINSVSSIVQTATGWHLEVYDGNAADFRNEDMPIGLLKAFVAAFGSSRGD